MDVKNLQTKAQKIYDKCKDVINEEELLQEVERLKHHALAIDSTMKTAPPATLLKLTYKHQEGYPNLTTVLKEYLTPPVMVSSGERSISK
ncbi:hypothetical protein PR048_028525 [Dryococelus australis]|uniref:HAT C-terminal dimerisation domain-containing protein n=1 Tax=Dryococelus australis TaxID=614101 RepID=A0ABQ9GEK9_9NEOP|nr:hypothetical protein PR048_028525 [Dryococelus australis]